MYIVESTVQGDESTNVSSLNFLTSITKSSDPDCFEQEERGGTTASPITPIGS